MNSKTIISMIFLLMAFLSPFSQAETYQDAQQADCYYATSDMVGKCAGHESKRDFAFSSIAKMITPQSIMVAGLVLAPYLGDNDTLSIVADKSKEGVAIQGVMKDAVGIFGIVSIFVCGLNILARLFKNAANAEYGLKENKFLVFLTLGAVLFLVGNGWIIHLVLAALIVNFVLLKSTVMFFMPFYINASIKDESAYVTRGIVQAESIYKMEIINAIQMASNDLALRRQLLVKHNLVKDVQSGKFRFVETDFSRCLENQAPASKYDGSSLKVGEITKTAQCLTKLQVNVYSAGSINSSGQLDVIKDANLKIFDMAYKEARKMQMFMCSTGLDKADNRMKYADSELLLNDCLDMNEDGTVADKDSFVHEFRDTVSIEELHNGRDQMLNVVRATVDPVVQVLLQGITPEKFTSDIFASFIGLMNLNNYQKKMTNAIDVQYSIFKISVNQNFNASDSAEALNENDKNQMNQEMIDTMKVQKLFEINRSIYEVYFSQTENKLGALALDGIQALLNKLTARYYENLGFQFKSCFNTDSNCVSPVLNVPASLWSNASEYTQVSLVVYYGSEIIRNGILTFNKNERYMTNLLSYISTASMFMYAFFMANQILIGLLPLLLLLGEIGVVVASALEIIVTMSVRLVKSIFINRNEQEAFDVLKNIMLQLVWICFSGTIVATLFFVGMTLVSVVIVIVNEFVVYLSSIFFSGGTGFMFDVMRLFVMLFLHCTITIMMFIVLYSGIKSISAAFKDMLVAKDLFTDKAMGEQANTQVNSMSEKFKGVLPLQRTR